MKNCLFLLLFLLSHYFCDGQNLKNFNPDDSAKIERPCGAVYDVNCVRKFISEHAKCKKTYGPVPDPIIRIQNVLSVPLANMTLTVINQAIRGVNGRIDEFYVNRDTNQLVIAIEFRNLSMVSDDVVFRFHRRAKEPVVTAAFASVLYPSVLITTVIPNIDDLQLDKAESVTFINELPPFFIAPQAAESSDPQVQVSIARLLSDVPTFLNQLYLTDSIYYPATYIQYNICDFGLKIR